MADQKTIVNVTSKNIKKGEKMEPTGCAIALAIRGLKLRNVYVDGTTVRYSKAKKTFEAVLPKRAVNFILKFDDGAAVKPFSFPIKPYEIDADGEKVTKTTKKTATVDLSEDC